MSDSVTSPGISPSAAAAPRRLSAELHGLNTRFGQEAVHLDKLIEILGDRTYSLLVVLLALPLFTPATLLGISLAIGPLAAGLGLGLALGVHPTQLPGWLRARRLPPRFFGMLLRGAERVIRLLERISRKRLPLFVTGRWTRRLIGAAITLAAFLLMIPAVFSNGPPAAAMICLAMGLLEEDGGMVLAGVAALLVSIAYFVLLGLFGVEVFEYIHHWYAAHISQPIPAVPVAP